MLVGVCHMCRPYGSSVPLLDLSHAPLLVVKLRFSIFELPEPDIARQSMKIAVVME